MANDSQSVFHVGLINIVTVVFVILKLAGYVSWSWFWVLCPTWISLISSAIIYGIAKSYSKEVEKK
jgi:hypothetical protein